MNKSWNIAGKELRRAAMFAGLTVLFVATTGAQTSAPAKARSVSHDPAEPLEGRPHPKILPKPSGAISRASIDEKTMRTIIHEQVSCGTRLTLSSWTDPKRGIGCGRD
ncbi:MAG: hypothetical protein WA517_11160, partial [Candidatus Acidiferrum sp.]